MQKERSDRGDQMKSTYKNESETMLQSLKDELGLKNIFDCPRIIKTTISTGVGAKKDDEKALFEVDKILSEITGQKAKVNKSKQSVSAFKLRENQVVGYTVTLRGKKMYDFLNKLTGVALPRVRDFKGLSELSFDGKGNFSLGISEHTIMPEVKYEDVSSVIGFQVNIDIHSNTAYESKILLKKLGFMFEKERKDG